MTLILANIIFSWQMLCGHIVQDDPYQHAQLSTEQLVDTYFLFKNQKVSTKTLVDEMTLRLNDSGLSDDDREILTKTLENERFLIN
jgi:hypothetical protein